MILIIFDLATQASRRKGECSKRSSSKAAGILARGAYTKYVSMEKARERSWRYFSTFPKIDKKEEKGHSKIKTEFRNPNHKSSDGLSPGFLSV